MTQIKQQPNYITLAEMVYKMVVDKQTESKEFKLLLQVYGRDKLKKLYLEEVERKRCEK